MERAAVLQIPGDACLAASSTIWPSSTRRLLGVRVLQCLVASLCIAWGGSSYAHGGHDHDHDDDDDDDRPAVSAPAPIAATASTSQVELVAARDDKDLVIYIDDYATNAPLDGLHVQLRDGDQLLDAAAAGDGVYRISADAIKATGAAPVTFVLHGDHLDLQVSATLPPVGATEENSSEHSFPGFEGKGARVGAVLLIVLVVGGFIFLRIRRLDRSRASM